MIGLDLRAMQVFYSALNVPADGCKPYLSAAVCMECLWKVEEHPQMKSLEEILQLYSRQSDTTDSIRHRMLSLLDMPWGEDDFLLGKICSLVRLL